MKQDSIFKDSFEEAYNEFQKSELSAKLSTKFTPKPYYLKFKRLKLFAVFGSVLFSLLSAITAFSFVFIISLSMNLGFYPAVGIAVVALFMLEYSKRLFLEPAVLDFLKFRKIRVVLFGLVAGLSAISIYSSFQGSKLAMEQLDWHVSLIDRDSVVNRYEGEIKAVESKIHTYQTGKEYRNSEGLILYKVSTELIPELEKEKSRISSEYSAAIAGVDTENKARQDRHKAETARKGVNLGYVTILCEVLLLLCLAFTNYYDYRSFVEMIAVENTVYTASSGTELSGEVLDLATRKIDADISSYQHKIKNKVGKAETARKRIAELTAKKAEINSLTTS